MSLIQFKSDSKYNYMLNVVTNWIYRTEHKHKNNKAKYKQYMANDENFITHDEIVKATR